MLMCVSNCVFPKYKIIFAGKYLKSLDSQTRVKQRWYEKLHQWQRALGIYEKDLNNEQPLFAHLLPGGPSSFLVSEPSKLTESKLEQLMGRMRCLKGLGEWQKLNYSCIDLLSFFTTNEHKQPNLDSTNAVPIGQSTSCNIKDIVTNILNEISLLSQLSQTQQADYKAKAQNQN